MAFGGVFCVVLGIGFLFGVYDAVWSLFMRSIGATDWQVGASFSLFAVPLVVMAPVAGWASDQWDRRWLAVASGAASAVLAPVYPLLSNIATILSVGAVEGAAAAFADPAMNAYLMDAVPAAKRGRAQGAMGTIQALATAGGAVLGGLLFSWGVAAPFVGGAAVSLVSILLAIPFFKAAGRIG